MLTACSQTKLCYFPTRSLQPGSLSEMPVKLSPIRNSPEQKCRYSGCEDKSTVAIFMPHGSAMETVTPRVRKCFIALRASMYREGNCTDRGSHPAPQSPPHSQEGQCHTALPAAKAVAPGSRCPSFRCSSALFGYRQESRWP